MYAAVFIDESGGVHEVPEGRGDGVVGDDVEEACGHVVVGEAGVVSDGADAVDAPGDERAGVLRWVQKMVGEGGVGGAGGVIAVSSDVDLSRAFGMRGELGVAELDGNPVTISTTRRPLVTNQGEELSPAGIGDLHATLVEVLD